MNRDQGLYKYSRWGADTLLILHALTVDEDAELVVDSPDTDVPILLIEMYQRLPAATSFLTGKRNLRRNMAVQPICEKLGEKCTSAMIGFHAFTGSDMSGRFASRSKTGASRYSWNVIARYWMLLVLGTRMWSISRSMRSVGTLRLFVWSSYRGQRSSVVLVFESYCWGRESSSHQYSYTCVAVLVGGRLYTAMIWRRATESHPFLPSPSAYGCELLVEEGIYAPIRCVNPQLLKQ